MPIPPFNTDGVIPPHTGNPCDADDCAPYQCSPLEVVQRFCFNPRRCEILGKWLDFRRVLLGEGFEGVQWLDGSFSEDKETTLKLPPSDLDLVTFYLAKSPSFSSDFLAKFPDFASRPWIKANFDLDHFWMPANEMLLSDLLSLSAWFAGLFGHRKSDGVRKGLVQVPLGDPADDLAARTLLNTVLTSPHP